MKRIVVFALIAAVVFSFGCSDEVSESSDEQSLSTSFVSVQSEPVSQASSEENEDLPVLELVYDEFISASTEIDGFSYSYIYCFDEDDLVFNAQACIVFPDKESAKAEFMQLKQKRYPNLLLDGKTLSFVFPKKQCPYYGISFEALPYLLENSIYEINEICPRPDEISEETEE